MLEVATLGGNASNLQQWMTMRSRSPGERAVLKFKWITSQCVTHMCLYTVLWSTVSGMDELMTVQL